MLLTSEQKQFIFAHENDNVRDVALQKSVFAKKDMPFLLAQISGRQIAKHKIPLWYANHDIIYPLHISVEQASSELTARYKASLLLNEKKRFIDLTGGMGVDFSLLSPYFQEAVYVEQCRELCELASHNFSALGLKNVSIKNVKSEDFLQQMPKADVIYLDPSRRSETGRKVFRIEDCAPNVVDIKALLLEKSDAVFIKYSPMLDISLAVKTLEHVSEVHIVSVENECKELLFILRNNGTDELSFIAVNVLKSKPIERFVFAPEEEQSAEMSYATKVANYLYEPNASILKAGAFNAVAQRFAVKKLHKNSHLYTSDVFIPEFHGRVFEVKKVFTPNKTNLKRFVSETKKANISVRNFPMSVAEIRKKSQLKEGGDVYVFATTLADEQLVWVEGRKM